MNRIVLNSLCTSLLVSSLVAFPYGVDAKTTLPGPVQATVVSVYDGDTLTVDAHPWPQITMRVSVRINGIDTPELRGRCADEKKRAEQAKNRTIDLVGDEVTLSKIFLGKYAGRVVADVANKSGLDVAQTLIDEGLARSYDGGSRLGWCADAG